MNRIIIYGFCEDIKDASEIIDISEIVCFSSEKPWHDRKIWGKRWIRDELIKDEIFDYVIITRNLYSWQDYDRLVWLGVSTKKIIHWTEYYFEKKRNVKKLSNDSFPYIKQTIEKLNLKIGIDIEDGLKNNDFFHRWNNIKEKIVIAKNEDNLVDVCFYLDYFLNHSFKEWKEHVDTKMKRARYVVLSAPYMGGERHFEWATADYEKIGNIQTFFLQNVRIVVIDRRKAEENIERSFFVVSHKDISLQLGSEYRWIYVGNCKKTNLTDKTGDNIAFLNPIINECTAIYWIWKNSNAEIVGINHYRRFFKFDFWRFWNEDILDYLYAKKMLKHFDFIVAEPTDTFPYSVKDSIKNTVNNQAYITTFQAYCRAFEKKQPEYLRDFNCVLDGYWFYPNNMFVSSKDRFDDFCEWFFSIVLDVVNSISVENYDDYSRRTIGFFAERLLTVYIIHNKLRIFEMPILFLENV